MATVLALTNTDTLVREVSELAMEKHGSTNRPLNLVPSKNLRPGDILGGLYLREAERRLGSRQLALAEARSVIRTNQLVITTFSFEDLLDLYRIEGFAYEYWRTSAAMRAIGKGAGIRRNPLDFLGYSADDHLGWLIDHYDRSTLNTRFAASLVGSWFPPGEGSGDSIYALSAAYNVFGMNLGSICDAFRVTLEGPARTLNTNFYLSAANLDAYARANDFMADVVTKELGFTLLACVQCLQALSLLAIAPHDARVLRRIGLEGKGDGPAFSSLLNLTQRGYGIFKGSRDLLVSELMRITGAANGVLDWDSAGRCLDHMTLTDVSKDQIGLWSRGRRFPLLPINNGFLIDISANSMFLFTLFVRMIDKYGLRG